MRTPDQLTPVAKSLGLDAQFRRVGPHRHAAILQRIIETRTTLGPSAIDALWWWESLRDPWTYVVPPDPIALLQALIPADEPLWFVAETRGGGQKRHGNFWLYESTVAAICAVLRETHAFEYYLVSRTMDWLICENHHDCLCVSGAVMVQRLSHVAETLKVRVARETDVPASA
jgi:hypothetical protein